MPPYEIEFSHKARRSFAKLTRDVQRRLTDRIEGLAIDPRPRGCEKLEGLEAFRIRAGDYRVVYAVDDETGRVLVTRVAHRRDVYRNL